VALTRFKAIENIHGSLPMNMDNGSISLSKEYWDELKRLGIEPEFTPYKCPSANGIVERFIKMTETQAKTGRLLFDPGFCPSIIIIL
jgi:transposase InsO family protein